MLSIRPFCGVRWRDCSLVGLMGLLPCRPLACGIAPYDVDVEFDFSVDVDIDAEPAGCVNIVR